MGARRMKNSVRVTTIQLLFLINREKERNIWLFSLRENMYLYIHKLASREDHIVCSTSASTRLAVGSHCRGIHGPHQLPLSTHPMLRACTTTNPRTPILLFIWAGNQYEQMQYRHVAHSKPDMSFFFIPVVDCYSCETVDRCRARLSATS